MRPPSLTAVQCADSPHSPAHAPCSPPATSHYTTGRLQAWDLCAPCRRLLHCGADFPAPTPPVREERDRKSTRLNSSHTVISYAVFCLKKKKKKNNESRH